MKQSSPARDTAEAIYFLRQQVGLWLKCKGATDAAAMMRLGPGHRVFDWMIQALGVLLESDPLADPQSFYASLSQRPPRAAAA